MFESALQNVSGDIQKLNYTDTARQENYSSLNLAIKKWTARPQSHPQQKNFRSVRTQTNPELTVVHTGNDQPMHSIYAKLK
jgi:hypothetical protein